MHPDALEEISALQAIYDDLEVNGSSTNNGTMHIICRIPTPPVGQIALLHLLLSSTYPFTSTLSSHHPVSGVSPTDTTPFRLRIEISGLPRGHITQQAEDHMETLLNNTPEGEATCLFPIISYFREEFALNPLLQRTQPNDSSSSSSTTSAKRNDHYQDEGEEENRDGEEGEGLNENGNDDEEDIPNIILRDGELSFIPRRKIFPVSVTMNGGSSSNSSYSSNTVSTTDIIAIRHGKPLVEKKSTFQAHIARVYSKDDVYDILNALKSVSKIARATHNMYAYRYTDPETRVLVADNDDDGEDAAGGRLAELLHNMEAMNLIVIVSRWFGGVLMGPSRFKTINNVARDLIEQQEWYQQEHSSTKEKSSSSGGSKKR